MAYLDQNDKLKDAEGQGGSDPLAQNQLSGQTSQISGNTAQPVGQPGAGGSQGWTNVQAYLNANKDNTSSSNLVKDVGSKFEDENSSLTKSANEAKDKASQEAEKTNIGQDKASQLIQQAASSDKNSDPYKQSVGQVQGALGAQYQGPKDFTYARDSKNQDYGQRLGSDQDFNGLMQNLYQGAAGGHLSSGMLNLQQQLDTQGPAADALNNARQNALKSFAGLNTNYEQTVPATQKAIQDQIARFGSQQQDLSKYLGQEGQKNYGQIDSAAQGHNADINNVQKQVDDNNAQLNTLYGKAHDLGDDQWFGNKSLADISRMDSKDPDVARTLQTANTPMQVVTPGMSDAQKKSVAMINKNIENAQRFQSVYNKSHATPDYSLGEKADLSNVGGVTQQRNSWNAIQDMLNQQNQQINYAGKDAANAYYKDKQNYGY